MPRVVIDSVSDDMKIGGGSKGFAQSFHKEGPAPFKGARVGPVVLDYSVGYPTDHKYNRNQNLDGRKKCSSSLLEDDDCSPIATTTTTTTTTTTRARVSPRSQTAQLRQAILNKNVYFLQTLISRSDSTVNPEADFSEQEEEEEGEEEGETDGDVADDENGGAFCASKPLHLAAQRGFADGVKVLFLAGANPDSADAFGLTPLHYAIMSGSAETVRLLSQLGSNLNAGDNDGDTPLHYAVRESNSDIVKLLIDFGVNPKIENCDGETPYTLACELNETKISIQLADSVRRTSGSFRWAGHSAAPASFTFV